MKKNKVIVHIYTPNLYPSDLTSTKGKIVTDKHEVYLSSETRVSELQSISALLYIYNERKAESILTAFTRNSVKSIKLADLIIIGCKPPCETFVRAMMPTGAIIARYSNFYGESSPYSRLKPEEDGYSLDMPKKTGSAKEMLSHDGFLEGILERDERKIREGLRQINEKTTYGLIVATPYLPRALEIKQQKRE